MKKELFSILSQVIPYLTGFLIAIFAEPLRQGIFRPILTVSFQNDLDCMARTPERGEVNGQIVDIQAIYVRVKVVNRKGVAKDCRACLINIEQLQNGRFEKTIFCDSIPLAWSCQPIGKQFDPLDLNAGVVQFADVVTVRDTSSILDPQIRVKPFRYEGLFIPSGTYRYTVQISAANSNPVRIRLIIKWGGDWSSIEVDRSPGIKTTCG